VKPRRAFDPRTGEGREGQSQSYIERNVAGEGVLTMPREPPELTLISIPQIERGRPLSQMHDWAGLLGFSKLANEDAEELAHFIALAEAGQDSVEGLTPRRIAATFKRFAKKLRWEQITGQTNASVRQRLANPRLGLDIDSFLLLAPLAGAPASQLLAAIETRQRELERMLRRSPQRDALESAGGAAVLFFLVHGADNVRDEPGAWWRFVLAFLDGAGFPTEKLRQHPESLRPLLDKLRVGAEPLTSTVRSGP
jgi:hypothetical protein